MEFDIKVDTNKWWRKGDSFLWGNSFLWGTEDLYFKGFRVEEL